jgi:hypothetical protein
MKLRFMISRPYLDIEMLKRGQRKREALPRDGTLWMASHRDSVITITNIFLVVNWCLANVKAGGATC